jgi:carbonic anhydrase
MKKTNHQNPLVAAFSLLVAACTLQVGKAAEEGAVFTYYETGGFGPSNWTNLEIENNECGGTNGASGFGQSPVTIDAETVRTCDTDMAAYNFEGGNCGWNDLKFSIGSNGKQAARSSLAWWYCSCFPGCSYY